MLKIKSDNNKTHKWMWYNNISISNVETKKNKNPEIHLHLKKETTKEK